MDAQRFMESYNDRIYETIEGSRRYVDRPADTHAHFVGVSQDTEAKERRRAYQREYEKANRHPCATCGKLINRQATHCRACTHDIQREVKTKCHDL